MKQVTLMMISFGCFLLVGNYAANYILVEIGDGIEGRGLDGNICSFVDKI